MKTEQEEMPQKRWEFWDDQFSENITTGQIIFDVVMGIIAPILCLIFDPGVFHDTPCNTMQLLSRMQFFTYTAVALGTLTLGVWLLTQFNNNILLGFIAGIFFAGALFAFYVGFVILSYMGAILGILLLCPGLIGFIPFLAAFVYWRNGTRAWRYAQSKNPSILQEKLVMAAFLGVFFVVTIPALVQGQVVPHFFPQNVGEQNVYCPSGE